MDLEFIQQIIAQSIFDPKLDDARLVTRRVFDAEAAYVNEPYTGAEINVPIVKNAGRATIVRHGEDKTIGETSIKMEFLNRRVSKIVSKFRVAKEEIAMLENAGRNGYMSMSAVQAKGQAVNRQIMVEEEMLNLIGHEEVPGLIYSDRSHQESVASWNTATPLEILAQITQGMMYMQNMGVDINDTVFLVSAVGMAKLLRPYSEANAMSLLNWLEKESGLSITAQRTYTANMMSKENILKYAPIGSTPLDKGAFILCSRNYMDVSRGTTREIAMNDMVSDGIGGFYGSCDLYTAGILVKFDGASYIGAGNEA